MTAGRHNRATENGGDWYQFIVTDERALSGVSVRDFLEPIIRNCEITVAVADDLRGAIQGLRGKEGEILATADFLELVIRAVQYDWGFLFLYQQARNAKDQETLGHTERITNADVTIRLADDQFFYVYTRHKQLTDRLLLEFPNGRVKIAAISELDIPY